MNNTNKQSFLLVAAMLLTVLLTGCLKDDLSGCPRPFQVTIKALDADRNDITELGDVQQVLLFVFDENDKIFETYALSGQEVKQRKLVDIQLRFPVSKSFKFIAWANLDDKVDYSEITTVEELSHLYVKLKKQSSRLAHTVTYNCRNSDSCSQNSQYLLERKKQQLWEFWLVMNVVN